MKIKAEDLKIEEMGLSKEDRKIMVDFIDLYTRTPNKSVLKMLIKKLTD